MSLILNNSPRGSFSLGVNSVASGTRGSLAQGLNATASGNLGSFAQGRNATAIGNCGSFAMGSNVVASGDTGSFAMGYGATANNTSSVQFGTNVNSVAFSLRVSSSTGNSPRLVADVPLSPQNGDMWINNGYVYIRSGGASIKLTASLDESSSSSQSSASSSSQSPPSSESSSSSSQSI